MLPDKYFCNFSLFQSLPDSWAIDQIFPIVPISRLNEQPTKSATIQDITCDSDGKIDNFISTRNFSYHLPVHELNDKEPYYLGVFLVGAYQEILGDLHNLFGDTNAVHIKVKGNEYVIDKIIEGETVADVLEYVQFSPKKMAGRSLGHNFRKERHYFGRRRKGIFIQLPFRIIRLHLFGINITLYYSGP